MVDVHYVIKNRDNETYTFDRNAQIVSNEDRNGNVTVYRYFDEDTDIVKTSAIDVRSKGRKGQLKEVEVLNDKSIAEFNEEYEDVSKEGTADEQNAFKDNRSIISFEYNDEGLIERVNMKGGKYTLYTYKTVSLGLGRSRSVLNSVTTHTSDDKALSYDYSYTDANLSEVSDAMDNAYKIEYYDDTDNLDKVKKVTYPNGEAKSYEYIKEENAPQDFVQTNEYTHKKAGITDSLRSIFSEDPTVISKKEVKYDLPYF